MFCARDSAGAELLSETYYSIGGGFVVTAQEREAPAAASESASWPYPFANAAAMLRMARESGLSIAEMKRANEIHRLSPEEVDQGLARLWSVMNDCIERGMSQEGELPGGLRVRRRAARIHQQLAAERLANRSQPHATTDWLSVYAMAVNCLLYTARCV